MDGGRGHVEQPQTAEADPGGRDDQVYRRVFGKAVPDKVRHRVQRRAGGLVGEGGHDALGERRRQPAHHRRGDGRDLGGGRRRTAGALQERARLTQLVGVRRHRLDDPPGRRVLGRALEGLLDQGLSGEVVGLRSPHQRVHGGDRRLRDPARQSRARAAYLGAERRRDREQGEHERSHRPTGLTMSSAFWRPKPSLT